MGEARLPSIVREGLTAYFSHRLTYHDIVYLMITQVRWRNAMPIIKPISDLRNKTNHISELVHTSHEPVFITKNGEGDMVLMSLAKYGEMERTLELYGKLAVAEAQATVGNRGRPLNRVMADLRKRIRASK